MQILDFWKFFVNYMTLCILMLELLPIRLNDKNINAPNSNYLLIKEFHVAMLII